MSVFFKDISPNNPVRSGDVERLLAPLGLMIPEDESAEYCTLLAAVHDCAERISALPDYQPAPDLERYPRENVRVPLPDEQEHGHAWAHRFLIRGRREASESSVRKPALAGWRVCVKDCIAVAGVPQFYGTDAFGPWTPSTDATVVQRVLEAGGDIHGTATCEHFCNSTSSFTSAQGTVENPHQIGYSSGGSTSGGAALVAGGQMDLALGTDQGGSIRVPAALCGCVGLKPTHGLVPFSGITSGDPVDDHAGPISRTVLETAVCLDVLAGYDGLDDRALGAQVHGSYGFADTLLRTTAASAGRLDGFRIGRLVEGYDIDIVQPGVRQRFLDATAQLTALGAVVEDVSVPLHRLGPAVWTLQQRMSGAAGLLGRAYGRRGLHLTEFEQARLPWTDLSFGRLFPSTKNTLINGLYLADNFPGLYAKTMNVARQIGDVYADQLRSFDVIVMPTTPAVAPRHGHRRSVLSCFEPSIGLTTNTAVFNVTGQPALTIPIGWAEAVDNAAVQLPVGVQIVGGLWQEHKILAVGHAWEKSLDWREQGR
ncbi:amidase [Grosmannia clavigera kw1407]|uniref:Amidase n=1 Tax=Grosmannia clavigera (strain kw1407 / UAMH 11150) TaxID=655863 RepID=F0XEX6_GROCL|nr:amidase [Grosmannia clavigera kw1407]EFX04756.1 amidase [Grosmannia clavigera kw1407]